MNNTYRLNLTKHIQAKDPATTADNSTSSLIDSSRVPMATLSVLGTVAVLI